MAPPRSPFPISQRAARGYGPAFANRFSVDIVSTVKKALNAAINNGVDVVSKDARAMTAALNQYASGKGGSRSLASVHQQLARKAQVATLEAYDARVDQSHPYRQGDRYSGGALRRALANPEMFVASYRGIVFMNLGILNAEARHWARLNYGAGAQAVGEYPASGPVVLRLFGQVVGAIEPHNTPRPGFGIPPGVWVGSEVAGRMVKWGSRPAGFYPIAGAPKRETRGIVGRHFFDAAFESLEENFPTAYEDLLREWVDQAVRTGKGLAAKATINSLTRFLG